MWVRKLIFNRSQPRRWSSVALVIFGLELIGVGFYFLFLRPAFLPEDLRFINLPLNQLSTIEVVFRPWLFNVFRVMGGFILAQGVLNITLAATSFHAYHRMAAFGVFVSGLASISLMTIVNFQIDSDFKWILLSVEMVWLASLLLFWLETRSELKFRTKTTNQGKKMKAFITSVVFTLALVGFTNFTQAEETKTTTVEHESHHVDEATSISKDMNKMDMKAMMHDCMKMHKDHKVCHQENIKTCEAKMEKKECAKMMKNMKHMKMDNK